MYRLYTPYNDLFQKPFEFLPPRNGAVTGGIYVEKLLCDLSDLSMYDCTLCEALASVLLRNNTPSIKKLMYVQYIHTE